jgi:hypothetical protein
MSNQARDESTNAAERTIIDDVVHLAIPPGEERKTIRYIAGREGCTGIGRGICCAYLMVASRSLAGKSSAATSPPTAMASPPAALISSTTACAFFSSRLRLCQRCTGRISTTVLRVRGWEPLLAHDDICAFLGKEESRTSTDSLCEQKHVEICDCELMGWPNALSLPAQRLRRVSDCYR